MIDWFRKLFFSDEPDKIYHTLRHTTIMLFLLLGIFPHIFNFWHWLISIAVSQIIGWGWEKIDKWRGVGWSWGDIWANTIGDGYATLIWLLLLFVKWIL